MKKIALFLIISLIAITASGQDRFQAGFFPEAGLNFSITDRWMYLLKIESQHATFDNKLPSFPRAEYQHVLTDVQSFISYKITYKLKGAIGYQYRIRKDNGTHRTIQQIAWVTKYNNLRLGSRLRTDQQFSDKMDTESRIRYRLASNFALNGERIDDGEKYLLLSNEVILAYQSNEFRLENRLVFGVGHFFNDSKKLEFSLDYRTDPYFPEINRHRLWFKCSYYWNIANFLTID